MSSEMWWCKCIALNDAATRIRKFRRFCVHVKLAEVDQTFTAKDLGRGVINTCSTGSISGTSLELKESKYEASWMEDTIRSICAFTLGKG